MVRSIRALHQKGQLTKVQAKWFIGPGVAQLYDTQTDPYELNNRIDDANLGAVRTRMSATLSTWLANVDDSSEISEAELRDSLLDGGQQKITPVPTATMDAASFILESEVAASMAYRIDGGPWLLYQHPVEKVAGADYEAKAGPVRLANEPGDQASMSFSHFTIEPTNSGFTDQLMQFSTFYRLGSAAGLQYLHSPFQSPRSSGVVPEPSRKAKWICTLRDLLPVFVRRGSRPGRKRLRQHLSGSSHTPAGIYQFLGFNAYLLSLNQSIDKPAYSDLMIGDEILEEANIKTFDELCAWLHQQYAGNPESSSTPILRLFLHGSRENTFALICDSTPNPLNRLALRAAYDERRAKEPSRLRFNDVDINAVVHMRQGDVSPLQTKSGSYIALWPKEHEFREFPSFEEIPSAGLVSIDDYHAVVKAMSDFIIERPIAWSFHSDGYERSIQKVRDNLHRFDRRQRKLLGDFDVETYEATQFDKFTGFDNSSLNIGEDLSLLYDLFEATFNADLVITSLQQRMLPKLMASYCRQADMPVVMVLHRETIEDVSGYH